MKLLLATEVNKAKGLEYLYVHPKNGMIWVDRYKKGKSPERLCRSLKTKNWAEAKIQREKLFERWLGLAPKKLEMKLVDDVWPDFLSLQMKFRKATYEACKYAGKRMMPFFGGMYPNEIDDVSWDRYIIQRRKDTHAKISFRNDIKWLKRFLKYAQIQKLYLDQHGVQLPLPKLPDPNPKKRKGTGIGKNLTDEQIKALLDKANTADQKNYLKIQILMGFTMFMRIGEIMLLDWTRVDLKKRVIILDEDNTKTKQYREANITEAAFPLLEQLKLESKSMWVFPSDEDLNKNQGRQGNKREWTECRRLAKVKCRFHDLRHSGLTRAFKNSNQWAQICFYAGLSLEEAERTYLHITSEDTRFVADLVKVNA